MEIGRVMVPGQPGQKKKKSFLRPYLSIKKLGMVMSFYYLSDGRKLKIVGCGPGEKTTPYLQNKHTKKDWRNGLSCGALTSQVRSPEYKPPKRKE
jgi:hypothetical protein